MKLITRIISAFPGIGKSFYHNLNKTTTLDSDSSNFSWTSILCRNNEVKKIREPDFPNNYIEHIKENIGKYDFVFVSSHKEVRNALLENCLFFYLIYPSKSRKEEFLQRYKERGSDEKFIQLISNNWDNWIDECINCKTGCKQICNEFLSLEKELQYIVGE